MNAILELARVIRDEDFCRDPIGLLKAWLSLLMGRVTPDDRYRPTRRAYAR